MFHTEKDVWDVTFPIPFFFHHRFVDTSLTRGLPMFKIILLPFSVIVPARSI